MNPRRTFGPLAWFRFAMIEAILGAAAVIAFLHGSLVVGWIATAIFVIQATARISLAVAFRRALARAAIDPPPPISPQQRERRMRNSVIAYQSVFGLAALAAAIFALSWHGYLAGFAWILAACFAALAVLMTVAGAIGRKRRRAEGQLS